ncbi:porin family protein [Flectobacillus sp. BAB-3569]|uniref:porin family protein n=1 Tax=Flectobacillus sp. BAB-3569 TaxID=1509483 RepID=UPI000BA451C9|nr:porin family protein [Flectobacillus sp. BAB-3569]PAC26305.1 hypothetical protein BWI92_26165 [Flectobacillus sp. BAB-3569]
MKKYMFSAMMLLGAIATKAQSVELIPKVGLSIARQNFKDIDGEKSKIGFTGGLAINIHTKAKGLSFQPEINFVNKGTKLNWEERNTNLTLNYLEVPLLAKYSFGPLYINAGPSVAMLLTKEQDVVKDYGNKPNRFEIGAQAGIGLAIPVGTGKVIIDGRYHLGFTDIVKQMNVKNRGVMVSLGYAIPL